MRCDSWFFFFNDTATTEIYTLSLHDALPICTPADTLPTCQTIFRRAWRRVVAVSVRSCASIRARVLSRSEEHTSELQSRQYLVCRLLLEKKKINTLTNIRPAVKQ